VCRVVVKDEKGIIGWVAPGSGSNVLKPGSRMHVPYWAKKPCSHVQIHAWHEWAATALESTVTEIEMNHLMIAELQELAGHDAGVL
jgi:hypothetical protein